MKKLIKLALAATMAVALLAGVGCETDQASLKKEPKAAALTGPEQTTTKKSKGPYDIVEVGPTLSPQEVATKIMIGRTTLTEVLALLGEPSNIVMNGASVSQQSSGRTVMYMWRKEFRGPPDLNKIMGNPVLRSLPGPFSLFSLGGSKARIEAAQAQADELRAPPKTLTMVFGSDGVLKDCQFNPHIPVATVSPSLTAVTPPR